MEQEFFENNNGHNKDELITKIAILLDPDGGEIIANQIISGKEIEPETEEYKKTEDIIKSLLHLSIPEIEQWCKDNEMDISNNAN